MPTRSALKTSRRELSEALPFGVGTLLVAEQSNLEERPKVGDIHRPIPVHYCPCQTLSGAQSMAVAVGSAFLANLAAWNLNSVSSCDDASGRFGTKSDVFTHTTDSTVRFAVQPTNAHHRR